MSTAVEVVAPSRLHFGMFSFGQPGERQFGGAGAMIERPGLRLRVSPAKRFNVTGPLAERVLSVCRRLARAWQLPELPACQIDVIDAPPEHVGLGTGTQLALSVTAGLSAIRGDESLDAPSLAALSGRGARSAIGTYGFVYGGLLVEGGKLPGIALSPLEQRVALPTDWRFVLVCQASEPGLSGNAEQMAFRDLPPVPRATTDALRREVRFEMIPAASSGDFERFSHSVYRFGLEAGQCFAARQGGPFASPRIASLVESVRRLGVQGVGQSSWGPTVFAVLPSAADAARFAAAIGGHLEPGDMSIVAEPNQLGARITRHALPLGNGPCMPGE